MTHTNKTKYCIGCEQAEVEETMAEVLGEGGTYAEARAHVLRFWEPILCDHCQQDDDRDPIWGEDEEVYNELDWDDITF